MMSATFDDLIYKHITIPSISYIYYCKRYSLAPKTYKTHKQIRTDITD